MAIDGDFDGTLTTEAAVRTAADAELQDQIDALVASPGPHNHAISDVNGLQTALDGKSDVGHGHVIADTTGLQAALDAKADDGHTHTQADVDGLTAALSDKQPLDAELTAIAGLTTAADKVIYWTGAGAAALTDLTALGRNIVAQTTTGGARTILRPSVSNQTGTSYTLVITDAGTVVQVNNAGTHTLTVPPNSSVAFLVGTEIEIVRLGAGAVNIAAGAGVTINSRGGLLGINGQYGSVRLRKRAADIWVLTGDLA